MTAVGLTLQTHYERHGYTRGNERRWTGSPDAPPQQNALAMVTAMWRARCAALLELERYWRERCLRAEAELHRERHGECA